MRPPRDRAASALGRLLASRTALWAAFAGVHGWLALVGVVLLPVRAFWDVDLYRYWASLALDTGRWPVLDDVWVYPAGALLPVVAPALTGARSTAGYAVAWCVLVTVLDALAVAVLLRVGRTRVRGHLAGGRPVPWGAWWWLAFLLALGPVAMGRLDAVVAPLCVVALAAATRRPAVAAVLLTVGAWIKVAPGALLLPLAAVARRPLRTVVLPAAGVCAVVVGAVAAGGGLARLAGFVTEQGRRGLQVEAVAATPWVLAALVDERVRLVFDDRITTWEVTGPGTATAVTVLGVALPLGVAALAVLLARRTRPLRRGEPHGAARAPDHALRPSSATFHTSQARHEVPNVALGGSRRQEPGLLPGAGGAAGAGGGAAGAADVLLWGALAASTLLLVLNKVGSPQLVGWLAAPVVVALTLVPHGGLGRRREHGRRRWGMVAGGVLVIAALTQVVFPLGAQGVVSGDPLITAVLAIRNAALVALLVVALRRLSRPAA